MCVCVLFVAPMVDAGSWDNPGHLCFTMFHIFAVLLVLRLGSRVI